ncbi:MAG: DMT family transporter [Anaerolineales bacterium]|nr:DMT family transporter [Anaerolineales bacterium]
MDPSSRISPTVTAALWMVGALLSFMMMAIGGRELAGQLTTFQILFFRSLIGLVVISAVLWRAGWHHIKTEKLGLHLLRNIAHYGGQYGWFYGLGFIPLAEVFAIEFTLPVWVAILAVLILGEKLTRPRIIAIVLGLIGLLLILRPGMQVVQPAALAVLAAAVGYAFSHVLTKKITNTDSALSVVFYMTLIQLPFGLLPSLFTWQTPQGAMWLWLVVVGVGALTAHYCMSQALKLADATVVVPMDFLRLPLIALVGVIFYSEALDWLVLVGGGVMLAGNWWNIWAEQRRRRGQAV